MEENVLKVALNGCLSCQNLSRLSKDKLPRFKEAVYELSEVDGLTYAVGAGFSVYVCFVRSRPDLVESFKEKVKRAREALEKEVGSEVFVVFSHFVKCDVGADEVNLFLCKKQVEKELISVLPFAVIVFDDSKEDASEVSVLRDVLKKLSLTCRFFFFKADGRTSEEELISFLKKAVKESSVEKILVFRESDLEDFNRFFYDEVENAQLVNVYLGRFVLPSVGKEELYYLREVDCSVRGGYFFDGVACLGVGLKVEGARKVYVFPLGFHRLVDFLKKRVDKALAFLRENRNEVIRRRVNKERRKLVELLARGGFSERFFKDLKNLTAPGELTTFLTKVEIRLHQLSEFFEGLIGTSYYEVSKELESSERKIVKCLLQRSLVVNDAEKFLTFARRVLGEEDYVIEENLVWGKLKVYSLFHFDNSVSKVIESNTKSISGYESLTNAVKEEREARRKIWADVYVYEGNEKALERGLSEVFGYVSRVGSVFKKQLGVIKKVKKILPEEKAVLPFEKEGDFVKVPLWEALLARSFFVNQVVLPLTSEVNVRGMGVDVEKALDFYEKVESAVNDAVDYYLRSFGIEDEAFIEEVASQVREGKVSAIKDFLNHAELVQKVIKDLKNEGIKPESEEFWFHVCGGEIAKSVKEALDEVSFERFKKELLFALYLNKLVKEKQFLEELAFFAIDGRVYPTYEVDGAVTGRLVLRNPAAFRWTNESLVVCSRCGALYESEALSVLLGSSDAKKKCVVCGEREGRSSGLFELDFSSLKTGFNFSADAKHAEVTVLASFSRDEALKSLLESGDVYCYLGSKVALEKYEDVLKSYREGKKLGKKVRRMGKKQAFLIIYGGVLSDDFVKDFKGLESWMKKLKASSERESAVTTLMGRVRFLGADVYGQNELNHEKFKHFVNTPIQGTTAELFLLTVYSLKLRLGSFLKVCFVNQDGFVGEVSAEVDESFLKDVLKTVASEVANPLKVLRSFSEKFFKNVKFWENLSSISFFPFELV